MSNEKRQTAVEWQFEELFNSFEKFNNKEYTFDEFLSNNLKIREQAKVMEKEQTIEMVYQIKHYTYFPEYTKYTQDQLVDKYYNETYGGNK
jgi:hypothetical protein